MPIVALPSVGLHDCSRAGWCLKAGRLVHAARVAPLVSLFRRADVIRIRAEDAAVAR